MFNWFEARRSRESSSQPTQLLVYRVVPVAHRGLSHLSDESLRVAQQQHLHPAVAMELKLKSFAVQPVRVAGALNDCPAGCGFTTHEKGDADKSLVAHYGDLC